MFKKKLIIPVAALMLVANTGAVFAGEANDRDREKGFERALERGTKSKIVSTYKKSNEESYNSQLYFYTPSTNKLTQENIEYKIQATDRRRKNDKNN